MTDTEIEESVLKTVTDIWDKKVHGIPLIWTYCTECGMDSGKQPCIGILTTGESLCARHFALRRIDEMRRERDNEARRRLALSDEHKKLEETAKSVVRQLTNERPSAWRQPLDVADFARL